MCCKPSTCQHAEINELIKSHHANRCMFCNTTTQRHDVWKILLGLMLSFVWKDCCRQGAARLIQMSVVFQPRSFVFQPRRNAPTWTCHRATKFHFQFGCKLIKELNFECENLCPVRCSRAARNEAAWFPHHVTEAWRWAAWSSAFGIFVDSSPCELDVFAPVLYKQPLKHARSTGIAPGLSSHNNRCVVVVQALWLGKRASFQNVVELAMDEVTRPHMLLSSCVWSPRLSSGNCRDHL